MDFLAESRKLRNKPAGDFGDTLSSQGAFIWDTVIKAVGKYLDIYYSSRVQPEHLPERYTFKIRRTAYPKQPMLADTKP